MLNTTSMLVIPTFILPAQSLSWVPDYLSSCLLTWPPGCLIGIQMFSSPKRTLDPLPSTPQPPVFLISVHGLNIHSTFTHSFHQQAPSSLPSMYIKLQSLLHHATSHCHELPQMCLSFLLVSPLFSTVSSTQRWFKNFNKSCHSCSSHTRSAQSPWSGLSWSLQFIPSSFPPHSLQSSPSDHIAFPPSCYRYSKLGTCANTAISDQKAPCRFWPNSLQYDTQISALKKCFFKKKKVLLQRALPGSPTSFPVTFYSLHFSSCDLSSLDII